MRAGSRNRAAQLIFPRGYHETPQIGSFGAPCPGRSQMLVAAIAKHARDAMPPEIVARDTPLRGILEVRWRGGAQSRMIAHAVGVRRLRGASGGAISGFVKDTAQILPSS